MRVEIAVTQQTYFANVMGISSMNNGAVAVAVHRPRDIALVLDFSVSMRFGSVVNWETGYGNSNDDVSGLMSPDPNYPKFGHYQRYLAYNQNATPNDSSRNPGTVANRANPLFMTNPFTMSSGEVAAQSNLTVETPGGPPVVFDFRFDPANVNDPTSPIGKDSANTGTCGMLFTAGSRRPRRTRRTRPLTRSTRRMCTITRECDRRLHRRRTSSGRTGRTGWPTSAGRSTGPDTTRWTGRVRADRSRPRTSSPHRPTTQRSG